MHDAMPDAAPDKPVFTYFIRHAGGEARKRGEIDLDGAVLLVKHFHWQPARPVPRKRRPARPGARFRLTASPDARDSDEALSAPMIGIVDPEQAELAVSFQRDTYFVDFVTPYVKSFGLGIRVRRWRAFHATTDTIDDVMSLLKLFFGQKKMVIEDLMRAAEQIQPAVA